MTDLGLPKRLRDPHDVEGRKWFRRALITLCAAGFALITVPEGWLDFTDRPDATSSRQAPLLVREECARVRITHSQIAGHRIVDLTIGEVQRGHSVWYDCIKTFSDGSKFRRIGDLKP